MPSKYPSKYLLFNSQQTKRLNVVVTIESLADIFSLSPVYTRVRYGDPEVYYGDPGLVYGGLRKLSNVRTYLMMDSTLAISQKLEPEQGRASASTLTLAFIDKDGYMSRLVSPGVVLDELLGNKEIKVLYGYQGTSYPEDYYIAFRGLVSGIQMATGKVVLTLTDANQKRRRQTFFTSTSTTTTPIDETQLTIPVGQTAGFYDHVQGPTGAYDPSVRTWILLDEEYMEYGSGDLAPAVVTVLRGSANSRGTAVETHDTNTSVSSVIELTGNAIDLALKIMLSGWNGPWKTGVACVALGTPVDTNVAPSARVLLLPDGVDAVETYGLVAGDKLTVSGSLSSNNGDYFITGFGDALGSPNRLVYVDQDFTLENPASTVALAFRSKYDTLPIAAGLKLKPSEVDVARHELIRNRYFSGTENQLRLFLTSPMSGKELIEKELFLPVGAYALTRFGRLSLGYTRPPVPEEKLIQIDGSNVIQPETITMLRGLNSRRFYNEITYEYDLADDGRFQSAVKVVDSESLTKIDVASVLPIRAQGVKSTLGGGLLAARRGRTLLTRFKNAAVELKMKVFWKAASLIEAGDVVLVRDEGKLKITDLTTGERQSGPALYEVIDRKIDPKTGVGDLTLLSGLGFTLTDRYGTISPSSKLTSASTASAIRIKGSFGELFPGQEYLKWEDYIGLRVRVHDYEYTQDEETRFTGFDPADNFRMLLDPPLSFVPGEDFVVDVADYPDNTDKTDQELYKVVHAFFTPTLTVVTGISQTQFTVSVGDAAKIQVGLPVLAHNTDFSILSPEVLVQSLVGVTVTTAKPLGFVPAAGQKIELVGFKDGGGPYRFL